MRSSRNADARAQSAMTRFRRRHDRRSKTHRRCENIIACIPALLFLVHLSLRAADITPPDKRKHHTITLTDTTCADSKVTVATPATTTAITAVPEPNVIFFVGLSFAALAYSRRKLHPTAQSSRIAIAAA